MAAQAGQVLMPVTRLKLAIRLLFGLLLAAILFHTLLQFHQVLERQRFAYPGSSAEYWEFLCGVQLPGYKGKRDSFAGATPVTNGTIYYFNQHHHGVRFDTVAAADVLRDLPTVRRMLTNPTPPSKCEPELSWSQNLCEQYVWTQERRAACQAFFAPIDPARADEALLNTMQETLMTKSPEAQYLRIHQEKFKERLSRYDYIWANYVFEAVFILAWLAFVFWPIFTNKPSRLPLQWRLGLAPFLCFVPLFLGYAPNSLTYGPSGGIVYPMYLEYVAIPLQLTPCTPLDGPVWQTFPQVLSGLSQLSGSPLAMSLRTCVGLVSSLVFALVVVGATELVRSLWRGLRRREKIEAK
jgi:hypothetical protein